MQYREKILAGAAAGLLSLAGLGYGGMQFNAALESRWDQQEKLAAELQKKDLETKRGMRAAREIQAAAARSLPADLTAARSEYQYYLQTLVTRSGLAGAKVTPVSTTERKTRPSKDGRTKPVVVARTLKFEVTGDGTMEQISRLLYDFYQADHLHQVTLVDLRPDRGGRVKTTIVIEAQSLPGAEEKTELPERAKSRLASAEFDSYQAPLVKRNMFADYVPPARPAPPPMAPRPPERIDDSKFTFLTAVNDDGVRPLVMVIVRTTNKKYYLGEGDTFPLGEAEVKVLEISVPARKAIFEVSGKRVSVALGKNLGEGIELSSN